MGVIAKTLVGELLSSLDPVQILLDQPGVIIKGKLADDSKNYMGCLLVVQHETPLNGIPSFKGRTEESTPATSPTSSLGALFEETTLQREGVVGSALQSRDSVYLIWVPYTFLAVKFPALLPVCLSHLVGDANPGHVEEEWKYIMCTSLSSVSKVQRHSNHRGVSDITLFLLDGRAAYRLIFHQGGLTNFLKELKKVSPLQQSRVDADEFIIYGNDDAGVTATTAAITRSRSSERSGGIVNSTPRRVASLQPFRDPVGGSSDARRALYEQENLSGGARLRASIATTITGVRSLFRNSPEPNARSPSAALHRDPFVLTAEEIMVDEPFELLEGLIPVEDQVPIIPQPRGRGMGPPLTAVEWNACFVGEERRLDLGQYAKAKAIAFIGGVAEEIRLQVWSFMLQVYPNEQDSTEAQRQMIRERYGQMYEKLKLQWQSIFPEQEAHFSAFREVRSAIEKDVVRTDRAHSAYTDDNGVKQRMLYNVLMSHAMFNFDLGYCQGMSDMLSPIALLADTEVEAFMCFSSFLGERCENHFLRDVKKGMKEELDALWLLMRYFVPRLYHHLQSQHADDMSFCFRWLIMLFKREFSLNDTMLLWDVIMCCPYTSHFELIVAAALLRALTPQILEQHLTYDELLKFANSTAGNLNVRHVILLAQEFYDEVAAHIMAIDSQGINLDNYQPSLKDILQVLKNIRR
ncbi:GTPase activating protein [Trypanosoma grayi]|uniref:GTPase activating protein n=1 Tax=Trypanosoma grayi TaxID=71804 RepID=UPI0004F4724F|nr:GTPase activating protein [Trypanosoma grayi]KEG10469.1 GTPase activating protein [Trypanosoma grayi]